MDTALEPINVSALNQYAYCPRRCALIYLEGEFRDNLHTARGNADHERVDRASHSVACDGARVEYALPVWNERLGLIGKCDIVEFWPDGTIYPVEYKHGRRKARINDDLQLAAQALCLEEMMGKPIARGAIFHHSSRRRREVEVDEKLRRTLEDTVTAIRALLASSRLPPPVNDARCPQCSMIGLCQPQMLSGRERYRQCLDALYRPE